MRESSCAGVCTPWPSPQSSTCLNTPRQGAGASELWALTKEGLSLLAACGVGGRISPLRALPTLVRTEDFYSLATMLTWPSPRGRGPFLGAYLYGVFLPRPLKDPGVFLLPLRCLFWLFALLGVQEPCGFQDVGALSRGCELRLHRRVRLRKGRSPTATPRVLQNVGDHSLGTWGRKLHF